MMNDEKLIAVFEKIIKEDLNPSLETLKNINILNLLEDKNLFLKILNESIEINTLEASIIVSKPNNLTTLLTSMKQLFINSLV